MTADHLFIGRGGSGTLLTLTHTMSCTRATMVINTVRENKRSFQPTAENNNLREMALR